MNILITGATGFIGNNLLKVLSKGNDRIFCLIRNKHKEYMFDKSRVELLSGDISDQNIVNDLNGMRIDMIYHCAARVSSKYKKDLYISNVIGTENICKLALILNVKRFIHTSSVAVVSGNKNLPLTEDLPYLATNDYGESKIEAEKKVVNCREKGLKAVIIRPCMVYGENEPHLMSLLVKLIRYRLIPMFYNGEKKLHLLYIHNLIDAIVYCAERQECLEGTFFAADKEVLSTKEVLFTIASALGAPMPFKISDSIYNMLLKIPGINKKAKFFVKDRVYSIEKLKNTGFMHKYNAFSALEKTARSFISE